MIDLTRPLNFTDPAFVNNKYAWYERILEEKPVYEAKISIMKLNTVARYEDCETVLKHPSILRNRTTATGGGSRLPFPMPPSLRAMVQSMILEDDPNHRRLRDLVRKAFRPQAIADLTNRIETYTDELLDGLEKRGEFDLQRDFALPIPVRMITDMLGVDEKAAGEFQKTFGTVTEGFTGLKILKTLMFDLPSSVKFVRQMIREKIENPGDDILTGLVQAEEDGDRLTEDELASMVMLLIIAGYETTVHLITNGVHTLLTHPDELQKLRDDPSLIDGAVEEVMRYRGPVHGTKPGYPAEDIEMHGVTLKRGVPIMPLLGAANHDPRVFENPGVFDITRSPNRHIGFGHGVHFCLGAHLARAETRIGINGIIQRFPNLRFGVDESELKLAPMPGWHRYQSLPVKVS